jgi:hypothetical protein
MAEAVAALLRILEFKPNEQALWLMGAFEGSLMGGGGKRTPVSSEMAQLVDRSLLPQDILPDLLAGPPGHVDVIVRPHRLTDMVFPGAQGYGHYEGVRIAIFPQELEPEQSYLEWLEAVRTTHRPARWDALTSDTAAPLNCSYWVCPFGAERREHAVIAATVEDPKAVVHRLADELKLPVVRFPCTHDEWLDWDWDCTPPQGMQRAFAGLLEAGHELKRYGE